MYFPKSSVSLNIAETSFVLHAISNFVNNDDENYSLSDDFYSSLVELSRNCRSMWSDEEWDVYEYMYHLKDFKQKWKVDRKAEWRISILDCDALILAMQHMYVMESKKAINGDDKALKNANAIKDILIPRFSNMFTKHEWEFYAVEIDSSNEDTIELRMN